MSQVHQCTLQSLTDAYWDLIARQGEPNATGFPALDAALGGGLLPGRSVVLLGGPGSGKTTWSHQVAYTWADAGHPVVFVSLEESALALVAKTLSREYHLDYARVLTGDQTLLQKIDTAREALAQRPGSAILRYLCPGALESSDTRLTLTEPKQIREIVAKHFAPYQQSGLIVIDYLQEFVRAYRAQHPDDRRELRECVGWMSSAFRQIAKTLNCTVLMLSSMKRGSGYGQEDTLSSAKESGDIEYDCDVVLALKAADPSRRSSAVGLPNGWERHTLEIAKNRQGKNGIDITLGWHGAHQIFMDVGEITAMRQQSATKTGMPPSQPTTPKRRKADAKHTTFEEVA